MRTTKGKIYEQLYSDKSCEQKLDNIEDIILESHDNVDSEFSTFDNLIFWFVVSGTPLIVGIIIGSVLL